MTMSPMSIYELLLDSFGQQHWWPVDNSYHKERKSDPRFEVIVGAILTQNTAWTNVEKALKNLKENEALTIQAINQLDEEKLKSMIQPSGFFNQKARRLKFFTSYLHQQYQDDFQKFFSRKTAIIRTELLSIQGIGPETADSILLYAGNHPIFVVDAYTKRISQRIPFQVASDSYDDIQHFFENALQQSASEKELVPIYKELHALLVECAKNYCQKKNPHCEICPLTKLCKKAL